MLYKAIALTTFLFGTADAQAPPACYATFSSSKSYSDSDPVSRISYVTTELQCCTKSVTCSGGSSGCSSTTTGVAGTKKVGCTNEGTDGCTCTDNGTTDTYNNPACESTESEVQTEVAHNYDCKDQQWCNDAARQPGTLYEDTAWTQVEVCDASLATATPAAPAVWNAVTPGCPVAWESGESYAEGAIAKFVDSNGFNLVYECTEGPNHLFCGYDAYHPIIGQSNLKVWQSLGSCDGSVVLPLTAYPGYQNLVGVGGCPGEYDAGEAYVSGDRVSHEGLVYECKSGNLGLHCPQAGYQPGEGTAYSEAWDVIGTCSGTIEPTGSPTFDDLQLVGGCPDEWSSAAEYEEGDKVSVEVSASPLRTVVYKCKAWPYSGYCGQLSPTEFGGNQGWKLEGYCTGTNEPTSSPTFDQLIDDGSGCPQVWSASTKDYEAGDKVSYVASTLPERKIVYKCREWPNTGYCNQGSGFEPGTQYGAMAWVLVGACSGTIAPTFSPTPYAGTCQYVKEVKTGTTTQSCTNGQTGCKCNGANPPVCTRTVDVFTPTPTPVDNGWQSGKNYVADDVIRIGLDRYKCREWPNYLWCRQAAYDPETVPQETWSQAWSTDGTCPPAPPAP